MVEHFIGNEEVTGSIPVKGFTTTLDLTNLQTLVIDCQDMNKYLPYLKKIENRWAVLKTGMKQRLKEFETLKEYVNGALNNCPNVCA